MLGTSHVSPNRYFLFAHMQSGDDPYIAKSSDFPPAGGASLLFPKLTRYKTVRTWREGHEAQETTTPPQKFGFSFAGATRWELRNGRHTAIIGFKDGQKMAPEVKTEHPHIVKVKEIRGGRPVLKGTGIEVALIVKLHKMGETADEILSLYPHLTAAVVYDALSYYYDHQEEIERYIADHDLKTILEQNDLTVDSQVRIVPRSKAETIYQCHSEESRFVGTTKNPADSSLRSE